VERTTHSDDPLEIYRREICSAPPLTDDEEIELTRQVCTGDEGAEAAGLRLLKANLAMVVSIAERHAGSSTRILELVQKGNEGLLTALRTLAETQCERFSTHAWGCVEAAIAKAARATT
jgi:DNA-directed RNA polymerase sigma subunit (sigma70/sigma32)